MADGMDFRSEGKTNTPTAKQARAWRRARIASGICLQCDQAVFKRNLCYDCAPGHTQSVIMSATRRVFRESGIDFEELEAELENVKGLNVGLFTDLLTELKGRASRSGK